MMAESETVKMIKTIDIVGVQQPEKIAEGLCPGCQTLVDLWITKQGLELSLQGKGYPFIPHEKDLKQSFNPDTKNRSIPKPIIIEQPYKPGPKVKAFSFDAMSDLLLMNIPCSINIKRTVFFIILSLVSIALLIQTLYIFWPAAVSEPGVEPLNIYWAANVMTTGVIALALIVINYISYKLGFSDSGPKQIDKWILASSIVILGYCLFSSIVLPVLSLYHLNAPLSALMSV